MKKKQKVATYKQVGTKKEKKKVHHEEKHDEKGNLIHEAYVEEIEIDVPVYGTVYEEVEVEVEETEQIEMPKSLEERVEDLEKIVEELKAKPKPKT